MLLFGVQYYCKKIFRPTLPRPDWFKNKLLGSFPKEFLLENNEGDFLS